MRALIFHRPPSPLLELIPHNAIIGLYHAGAYEAPTASYAKFFLERGHELALPRLSERDAAMQFAQFIDPYEESDLEAGPFGMSQPSADAPVLEPTVLFVPLVGFTDAGMRLGQGGGHYDRWLAVRPETTAIGLAWDCQRVDELPVEDHDVPLSVIVTPTRLYGPFE